MTHSLASAKMIHTMAGAAKLRVKSQPLCGEFKTKLVAHTGLEPVISALRGQRVNQLHQCAIAEALIIGGAFEGWQT